MTLGRAGGEMVLGWLTDGEIEILFSFFRERSRWQRAFAMFEGATMGSDGGLSLWKIGGECLGAKGWREGRSR
jgi:hypothetical protein